MLAVCPSPNSLADVCVQSTQTIYKLTCVLWSGIISVVVLALTLPCCTCIPCCMRSCHEVYLPTPFTGMSAQPATCMLLDMKHQSSLRVRQMLSIQQKWIMSRHTRHLLSTA